MNKIVGSDVYYSEGYDSDNIDSLSRFKKKAPRTKTVNEAFRDEWLRCTVIDPVGECHLDESIITHARASLKFIADHGKI